MIDNINTVNKTLKEINSIKQTISTVFYNESSPFFQTLNPTSIWIPEVEDHKYDASALTRDNQAILLEVKSSTNSFYVNDKYNSYFYLNDKMYSFENVPDEDDDMFVYGPTSANCPYDSTAYNTTIPEKYKNVPFYYINAASTGPKQGEVIFENGCKLKKMLKENQAFAYITQDGVIYFTPEDFQKALGPYVRKWCRNKNDYSNKLYSWEVKRLIDLRKGTFIPFS